MPCALALDLLSAGNNKAARMAMMAITTNSSISVNPNFLMPGASLSVNRTVSARQNRIVEHRAYGRIQAPALRVASGVPPDAEGGIRRRAAARPHSSSNSPPGNQKWRLLAPALDNA